MEAMVPMLVMFKGGGLIMMAVAAVGLLSFKAIIIGKVALFMASILMLKKLMEGKHQSHPVMMIHDHPHEHEEPMYMDMEVGAHSMPSSQYTSAGLYGYGALAHGANSGAAGVNNPANLAETMASFGQDATSGDNAIHYSDTATLMEMMNQQLQQQAAFNETLLLPNKRKDVHRRRRPLRRHPVSHYLRIH